MRRKRKLFKELKAKLREQGLYPYGYLADVLGWSESTLGAKMAGVRKWEGTDLYELMYLIGEPLHMIPFYFPPEDMGVVKAA